MLNVDMEEKLWSRI